MEVLLKAYTDILLRRQGPDVLPASRFLLQAAFLAYFFVGLLALLIQDILLLQPVPGVLAALFDAFLLCAWFALLLSIGGYRHRLNQCLSAALGCGALIGLCMLPVLVFVPTEPSTQDGGSPSSLALGAVLFYVLLLSWFATVLGHIAARALQINALAGLALGIFYVLASIAIVSALFPLVD